MARHKGHALPCSMGTAKCWGCIVDGGLVGWEVAAPQLGMRQAVRQPGSSGWRQLEVVSGRLKSGHLVSDVQARQWEFA